MYMIEITENKFENLYEHFEKGFKYLGKAMSCLEEMREQRMGHRDGYGHRESEWEEESEHGYGERGRMGMRGRYSRY